MTEELWSLLYFSVVCMGVTYVMTESRIGAFYRGAVYMVVGNWPIMVKDSILTLIYCPACTGFWVGLGLSTAGRSWQMWSRGSQAPLFVCACMGMLLGGLLTKIFTFESINLEMQLESVNNDSSP